MERHIESNLFSQTSSDAKELHFIMFPNCVKKSMKRLTSRVIIGATAVVEGPTGSEQVVAVGNERTGAGAGRHRTPKCVVFCPS